MTFKLFEICTIMLTKILSVFFRAPLHSAAWLFFAETTIYRAENMNLCLLIAIELLSSLVIHCRVTHVWISSSAIWVWCFDFFFSKTTIRSSPWPSRLSWISINTVFWPVMESLPRPSYFQAKCNDGGNTFQHVSSRCHMFKTFATAVVLKYAVSAYGTETAQLS